MGCVSGFGSSLVVVSSVVVATYYFEDKPSFASGFVISGGSLGPTIFPLIIIKLNDSFGRSGCFLILGALILNIIVCGALFRPLEWELDDECSEEMIENDDRRYNHHLPNFMSHFPLNLRNYYYKSLLNLNSRLIASLSPTILSSLDVSTCDYLDESTTSIDYKTKYSLSCPNLSASPAIVTVDDLNYRLKKYNFLIQNQKLNITQRSITNEAKQQTCSSKIYKKIKKLFQSLFESIISTLKLFRFIEFTIFAVCSLVLNLFYEAPFYFINSYMTENNFTRNQAGIVNAAVGAAGIIASITYGYIGDIKRLNWILLYSFSIYLTALCHFALPFIIHNYALTMIAMVLISMSISVTDVLVPIICVHTVGNDDFVSAYGLIFFCQGISSLVGPPILGICKQTFFFFLNLIFLINILGYVVDITGNYAYSYNIGGIGMCISASILLTILIRNKCKKEDSVLA